MISNKALLRIGCFTAALLALMLGLVLHANLEVQRYRRQLENSYLRALGEISSQMNAITADLTKTGYAGTPAQISAISAKVWRNAGSAKAAFGALPAGEQQLKDTYRFLSQVGDYSMYLSRKAVGGQEITAEERESFEKLTAYSRALSAQIADLEYRISTGETDPAELYERGTDVFAAEPLSPDAPLPASAALENKLESYPTLIYDGPFSDNLLQKSSAMTRGEAEVTQDEARKRAAAYADVSPVALHPGSDENSSMPSYSFTAGELAVGVTRQGGHVVYLVDGREIGARKIALDHALDLARDYLETHGLGSLRETYYELANGLLTVNYAFAQDDVLCYTDLVKVGIAMDNGTVAFFDARGYVNNHRERSLPEAALTEEQAAESLSPNLGPVKTQLALVPTAGGGEALTHEFLCKGKQGEDVLVYVNVETGAEEQILILIESENGTLTI